MKTKAAPAIFIIFLLAFPLSSFAQIDPLAEQYKRALTPLPSQKLQPLSQKRTKGIAGVSQPTRAAGGVSEPSLTMHLEFKFNSDELTPQTIKYLDALGTALQDPTLRGYLYRIEGHTCNIGSDAYNLDLSRRRALSVVDYMVRTFGLQREQFEVQGYGKDRPVASNDTEESRQQNRRVVIVNTLHTFHAEAINRPSINVKVKYSRAKEERNLSDGDTLTHRDNYAVEFTPKTTAHVYVYQVDATGNVTRLYPNPEFSQSGNPVEPGRLYRVPNLGRWLYLDANKGTEHIVVVAQKDALEDPLKVCNRVLGSKNLVIASSHPSANRDKRGAAQKYKSVAGIRPEVIIEAGPQVVPADSVQESKEPVAQQQVAKPSEPEGDVDMNRVFVWKLSFLHQ